MELSNKDILTILTDAKESYLKNNGIFINNGIFAAGMCHYIQEAIFKHTKIYPICSEIKHYIPEFIPETFNIHDKDPNEYWWLCSDTNSRIKAFDKLISIYKRKCKNK